MKKITLASAIIFLGISFSIASAANRESGSNTGRGVVSNAGMEEKNKLRLPVEKKEQVKAQQQVKALNLNQLKNQWKSQRQEALGKLKQEREKIKNEFKNKFTEEKCARVQARVQNREKSFEGKKEKHMSVYVNLVNRMDKFIARFDEQKLDTTAIKNHRAELQAKIEKFKNDYDAYAASLGTVKTITCGHTEGEFKGNLLETKTLLKAVHDDAADIRAYVRATLLVDIKELKVQMQKMKSINEVENAE